jgi:hypothetical protein
VPTIFFAVIPSFEHVGTNTTAPPSPVSALSDPALSPHPAVKYCHPGLSGAETHFAAVAATFVAAFAADMAGAATDGRDALRCVSGARRRAVRCVRGGAASARDDATGGVLR